VSPLEPERQFDFWLGDWDVSWDGGSGLNVVRSTYGGRVIEERFEGRPVGLNGMSVSLYDPRRKVWRQTWVDDAGGYFALAGTFADGRMILETELPGAVEPLRRMVFCNIRPDSLDWLWEGSGDGTTWAPLWRIHYERRR
jgi:hypothetical protein